MSKINQTNPLIMSVVVIIYLGSLQLNLVNRGRYLKWKKKSQVTCFVFMWQQFENGGNLWQKCTIVIQGDSKKYLIQNEINIKNTSDKNIVIKNVININV